MAQPVVNHQYLGTIIDVTKHGLIINLNGFKNIFEGFIHNSELVGDLRKLIVGDLVRVRIVSDTNQFYSMTIRNVDQPFNDFSRRMKGDDNLYKIRVASPGRREVRQYTNQKSDVKVQTVNDDPPFLKSLSKSIISSRIPQKVHIFRNQYSPMAKVAKAKMLNPTTNTFYFTEVGFETSWENSKQICCEFKKLRISGGKGKPPVTHAERKKISMKEQRESLPIYKFREEIIKTVSDNPVTIVIAETGSGKYLNLRKKWSKNI